MDFIGILKIEWEEMLHYDKMKMADLNGIRLITIFEHEWLNREKQVKNFLKIGFIRI